MRNLMLNSTISAYACQSSYLLLIRYSAQPRTVSSITIFSATILLNFLKISYLVLNNTLFPTVYTMKVVPAWKYEKSCVKLHYIRLRASEFIFITTIDIARSQELCVKSQFSQPLFYRISRKFHI